MPLQLVNDCKVLAMKVILAIWIDEIEPLNGQPTSQLFRVAQFTNATGAVAHRKCWPEASNARKHLRTIHWCKSRARPSESLAPGIPECCKTRH